MKEALTPGGRKKGKHENIELRQENSSLGTGLQSSLKLRWPHILFAWGQLTYTCCPSFIIGNILFTQKYCRVDNEVHCYSPRLMSCTEPPTKWHRLADMHVYACTCVPGWWESCSETKHWLNGCHSSTSRNFQHRLRLQVKSDSQEPLP